MLVSFEVKIYDRAISSTEKKDARCGSDSHGDTIKRFLFVAVGIQQGLKEGEKKRYLSSPECKVIIHFSRINMWRELTRSFPELFLSILFHAIVATTLHPTNDRLSL